MPRLFTGAYDYDDEGSLVIERPSSASFDVFYTPSTERLKQADIENPNRSDVRIKLLQVDRRKQKLMIFPINAFPSVANPGDFLQQKYTKIKSITIENWPASGSNIQEIVFPEVRVNQEMVVDFGYTDQELVMMILEELPSCFIKDYDYGLGFTRPYRFIIDAVESLSDCTEIVVSDRRETSIEAADSKFYISVADLEEARKTIDRTVRHSQTAARSVNTAATHNLFARKTGQPLIPIATGRSPLRRMLTEVAIRGNEALTQSEQDEMLDIFVKNTRKMVSEKPQKIATIRADMELVTLEALIDRFQEMMQEKTPEREWQEFLNVNSFILSLAFGYPIVKVSEQASVGGHTISGSGETIADYLVKNSLTNNCAIVEIKTPGTKLLNKAPYHGSVFPPTRYLVGAVNQALNQKNNFEKESSQIKVNSRLYDIESFAVSCCLIIGTMPDDIAKQQSFELFRGNSKNVQIITFDELLLRLTSLRDLLSSPPLEKVTDSDSIELPF